MNNADWLHAACSNMVELMMTEKVVEESLSNNSITLSIDPHEIILSWNVNLLFFFLLNHQIVMKMKWKNNKLFFLFYMYEEFCLMHAALQ